MSAEATDLRSAVWADHPCESESCDIALAYAERFDYVAADLLRSATEAPRVDAAVAAMGLAQFKRAYAAEWDDWATWYAANTIECGACNRHSRADSAHCGNCLAPLAP